MAKKINYSAKLTGFFGKKNLNHIQKVPVSPNVIFPEVGLTKYHSHSYMSFI